MIRDVRTLALSIVLALATSAAVAPGAQAEFLFTTGATPGTHTASTLRGEQFGTGTLFQAGGVSVTCENQGVSFSGSTTGTNNALTLTPTYKDCTGEGLPATFNMNGCDYVFYHPLLIFGGGKEYGEAHLVCPKEKSVDIEIFLFGTPTGSHSVNVCTVQFLPDSQIAHLDFTAGTSGGKDDLTIDVSLVGIPYKVSGSCGAEEGSFGSYNSTITLTAKSAAGQPHDLWISED